MRKCSRALCGEVLGIKFSRGVDTTREGSTRLGFACGIIKDIPYGCRLLSKFD